MIYQRSSQLFKEAQQFIPGGVNSPVRAFKSVKGTPVFIKEAKGVHLIDEDNQSYIDYISSWGCLIFGHAYPPIIEAVSAKLKKGTSFGMPTQIETLLAEKAISMIPNADKIRFVNSGTEACMSAIRLARGVTQREKIIKFEGCYHGHADSFLIKAGSGALTFGAPNSPGVTKGTASDTLLATYNNLQSVKELFTQYPNEIAAIILEPVCGNMGCIVPEKEFLSGLRKLCNEYNSLLIFDEVMTGFRLAKGGAQELFGIKADIVTYGKIIGGGLPVGAFAASSEIMSHLAPEGSVYQAGTLSGNPLAMMAGYTTLMQIEEQAPQLYSELDEKTKLIETEFRMLLDKKGVPYQINRVGSMMSLHFTDNPVNDLESATACNMELFNQYFHGMLKRGVFLPPSAYESYFISNALTSKDIEYTVKAFAEVLNEM